MGKILLEKITTELKTELPTRILLVIPITEGNEGHIFETQQEKQIFLKYALSQKGNSQAAFKEPSNTLPIQEKLHFT